MYCLHSFELAKYVDILLRIVIKSNDPVKSVLRIFTMSRHSIRGFPVVDGGQSQWGS